MPAGQEKPPWGVARPRGTLCVSTSNWGESATGSTSCVIARVARPVAIRAPVLPPTSNPARGIRIATGINALAMTWENIPGCVCTLDCGGYEVQYVADRPGGRSLHGTRNTPCRDRHPWRSVQYIVRFHMGFRRNRNAICCGPSGRPVPTFSEILKIYCNLIIA